MQMQKASPASQIWTWYACDPSTTYECSVFDWSGKTHSQEPLGVVLVVQFQSTMAQLASGHSAQRQRAHPVCIPHIIVQVQSLQVGLYSSRWSKCVHVSPLDIFDFIYSFLLLHELLFISLICILLFPLVFFFAAFSSVDFILIVSLYVSPYLHFYQQVCHIPFSCSSSGLLFWNWSHIASLSKS